MADRTGSVCGRDHPLHRAIESSFPGSEIADNILRDGIFVLSSHSHNSRNGMKRYIVTAAVAVALTSCLNDAYYEVNTQSYSDFEFYHPIEQFGSDSIYVEGMFNGGNSSAYLVFASQRSGDGAVMTGGFGLTMKKDTLVADGRIMNGDDVVFEGDRYSPFPDTETLYPAYTAYGTRSSQGENMCTVFMQAATENLMPEHDIIFTDPEYGTCTPQICRILNTYKMVYDMMYEQSPYRFGKGDWLKLVVRGYLDGRETGSVEYYLADFRSEDNDGTEPDSLLTRWKNLPLTALGQVDNIDFELEASKNLPSMTVCMDDFLATIYIKR